MEEEKTYTRTPGVPLHTALEPWDKGKVDDDGNTDATGEGDEEGLPLVGHLENGWAVVDDEEDVDGDGDQDEEGVEEEAAVERVGRAEDKPAYKLRKPRVRTALRKRQQPVRRRSRQRQDR